MTRLKVRAWTSWLILLVALVLVACGGKPKGDGGDDAGSGSEVSGTMQAGSSTAVDSDVNDPSADYGPNDNLGTAQELPNPVTVGGYLNVPLSGPSGRSFILGDASDFYRISLGAGQTLRLSMSGDGMVDDLDMALLRLNGSLVVNSAGNTPTEFITVPEAGDFVIEISAFAGASNYVLVVGQSTSTTSESPGSVLPDFVPGELIVRYRDEVLTTAGRSATGTTESMGMRVRRTTHEGPDLIDCREEAAREEAFRELGIGHLRVTGARRQLDEMDQLRRDTLRLAKAMRRRGDVVSADPNYLRQPLAVPNDEFYPLQWHYPLINLPQAWDNIAPNSGVVVAVIDTGVALNHSDLDTQLVNGYDFISDLGIANDGNGCDGNPDDPGDGFTSATSSYHGTHVAGTIVAETSLQPGGSSVGVAGVAWNARVMPLRVLGVGGGTDFDIIQAVRHAAGLSNACGTTPQAQRRADVINMSLGGPDSSGSFQNAVDAARNRGVVIVASAGNEGTNAPLFPAAFSGVISVSAVDQRKDLAPYSNFGSSIDVAAPGGDLRRDRNGDGFGDGVLSTLVDPGAASQYVYGFYEGTSMAAPHVAGVIALMLGVNPALTPTQIDGLLDSGEMTEDIGSSSSFGNGLIDAFASVNAAFEAAGQNPPADDPRLEVDPGALNFGTLGTQALMDAENGGGDDSPLVIASVSAATDNGGGWLSIVADAIDGDGLGSYRVRIDRDGLADGTYTGTLSFDSNENDLDVPVIMQVGELPESAGNAGHHFILLVDPDSLETLDVVDLESDGGRYRFLFEDVPDGEYALIAGTDADNDNFICDSGEACGAYPTLEQMSRVTVDGDLEGLDFSTNFDTNLEATNFRPDPGDGPRAYSREVKKRRKSKSTPRYALSESELELARSMGWVVESGDLAPSTAAAVATKASSPIPWVPAPASQSASGSGSEPVVVSSIHRGDACAGGDEADLHWLSDPEALAAAWTRIDGEGAAPSLDWSRERGLLVEMGRQPAGIRVALAEGPGSGGDAGLDIRTLWSETEGERGATPTTRPCLLLRVGLPTAPATTRIVDQAGRVLLVR